MIFTNISWAGDFFLLWPVASAYYKETGEKIHWVVSKNYYMYILSEKILRHQDFTENVTLVDHGSNAWNPDEWMFNPSKYGINGDYMNFGFTNSMWGKYMPDFYASLHDGLRVDNNYTIKTIDFPDKTPHKKVTMEIAHQANDNWKLWKSMMPEDVISLNPNDSFELNLWYIAKAEERYFGPSSQKILCDLMNLPCTIFVFKDYPESLYLRNKFHKIIRTDKLV